MPVRKREDEVFPNAAGIDVGASSHWVAVPSHLTDDGVREFGPMTTDLSALADWLLACGVDTVALESTGVYWIPVYEVLEQRGLKVWLVDARQMKYVPGRKSDVQDCQWLQKLMSLGLLRAAWRPDGEVCVVRVVARQREVLLIEQASWVQRMQKALVQMNIQLTEVLSDVMGMTGQAIIRAIVAGERNPLALARHRNRRIKASDEDLTKALTGNWREEHLFVLAQASSKRSAIGSDSTHWRTGTCGMTWSTRCAAVCDMRRAPHDGQNPRRLQLKASSLSWPHSPQRSLRKPCARMPHSRKASNSSLMNRGSSAPVMASVRAMKLAACCCTRRYSVVCSGRWRS